MISGLVKSPGEGNGNPLQYSCMESPMDRGAWQATVHVVTRVGHDLATKPPPTHCQARSQKTGMSRATRLWIRPSTTGRQGEPELEGDNCGPREASSSKLQAGFIGNQDFLGFWTVDIHWEGRSQRSAPQKRHTAHLRRRTCCTPRKLSNWDGGGDKMQAPTGGYCAHQAPGHMSCSDLERAQNAGPTKSAPLWSTRESKPEWLRPGKCMQPRAHLRQFPAEQPKA